MAIQYEKLMRWPIPDAFQEYSRRDTILYALGLGFGSNPLDPRHLRHLLEKDLVAFPSMAVVLATGGSWARSEGTGIDFARVLHAEQRFEIHRPLPVEGSVRSRTRVAEVIDKGEGRGAIVVARRELFFGGEDSPGATLESSLFCRGDGGFGGPVTASPKPLPVPERDPDARTRIETLPQSALIYRLSGDYNELHADPEAAARAGFRAPILHGLCSFGMALRSALEGLDVDPAAVAAAGVRFTSPVYPGETLETEAWREDERLSFRTRIVDRGLLALDHGWVRVR